MTTKKDIVNAIAEKTGLAQVHAREVVHGLLEGITKTLLIEGRIELRNFGIFEVKQRKPRKGRNPKTGQAVDVPAKLVVTFKPGLEMGERVGKSREATDAGA